MEIFNAPALDRPCEARETSTVVSQVFAMLNSRDSYHRALALGRRAIRETCDGRESVPLSRGERQEILARLIELVYSRRATHEEVNACLQHWSAMETRHVSLQFSAQLFPSHVIREAVEENTGEKFWFSEPLEVAADFVPDVDLSETSAALRGLAEVCLVLFNSNEFLYVY